MTKRVLFTVGLSVAIGAGPVLTAQAPRPASPTAAAPPAASVAGRSTIVERVLVRVNGEIFTQSQLTERQIDEWREQHRDAQTLPDDATLQKMLDELTPDILVNAVDELLLVQRARELSLKFTDEAFKTAIDNIKKSNKFDDAQLKTAMAQQGLTLESLRQRFETTYLVNAVQSQEFGRNMSITQEELRQYYDAHHDEFMTTPTVTLREIFVQASSSAAGAAGAFAANLGDQAAKTKIDALRARAVGGEDFATLAQAESQSATKSAGGLVGPVALEDLNPALKLVLDALKPGEITQPVRGGSGYQIFKLETRTTPVLEEFEKVKLKIEQSIREDRIDVETQKLLKRLRTQAVIEWKDEALRGLYDKRIVALAK